MADLVRLQSDLPINIAGVNPSTGVGTFFANVDSNGNLLVNNYADGPVTPGTAAPVSSLIGGQFNTVLPTLTNTQQSAIQLDSSGRIIVRNSEFPSTVDTNFGTVGVNTIRTASELGNSSGAADFNFGAVGAQTLRTAAEIGNATGAADFGAGSATAQTLRVTSSNFPTTLDTNYGTVGASTLRTAAQIGNATGAANFNFGAVGAQTLQVASQIGNATGAALFGAGTTTAQVLRVVLPTDQTGINTFLDKSGTGTISALNQTVTAITNGCSTVCFTVEGTLLGSIVVEGTADGTNWTDVPGISPGGLVSETFADAIGLFDVPCGGLQQVRLQCYAYTSGTATVTWNAGAGVQLVQVFNSVANNLVVRNSEFPATVDTNFGTVGADTLRTASEIGNATGAANFGDGATTAQTLRTSSNLSDGAGTALTSTTSGAKQALDVVINAPTKATYNSGSGLFTPPATPTDMWVMQGSATKTIKILSLTCFFIQTNAGNDLIYLKRYSTADTAGTSTTIAALPLDINDAASTATIKAYTANPTLGTLVGDLDIVYPGIATNGGPSSETGSAEFSWNLADNQGQPLVLRGTTDQIAVNFNGAAKPAGFQIAVSVRFTEE